MNRRNFIKNMAVSAGSVSPLLKVGGGLGLLSSSVSASEPSFDDYKAIVIIHMDGGNDAMNTFPPTDTNTYAQYANIRRNLAVKDKDLSKSIYYKKDTKGYYKIDGDGIGDKQPYWPNDNVALGDEGKMKEQYTIGSYHTRKNGALHDDVNAEPTGIGIHAYMPEIAALYENKKLSIVSNIGILNEPITKGVTPSSAYPPFLFSHLHQYRAVGYLSSNPLEKTGWAGRLADRWKVDGRSIGLNLSFTNGNALFAGKSTNALKLSSEGMKAFPVDNDYLKSVATDTYNKNNLKRAYKDNISQIASFMGDVNATWSKAKDFTTFEAKNTYGKNLFHSGGDNDEFQRNLGMRTHHGLSKKLFSSLQSTAKMIELSKNDLKHKRQIFNVSESGYDFHGGQVDAHTKKLRALSMGVSDFYKALEEMEMEKEVLVILTSEFGRTMKSNEDGTDHGWGGHSFMLCGDDNFNGGNIFGKVMTNVELDGPNAHTNRARIIPTTSIEQMLAPALDWFGVDADTMDHVLPNLKNFRDETGEVESAYLKDVFS